MFRTLLHFFFRLVRRFRITKWFELLREKIYRNDLQGNKSYFEKEEGWSCQGFELPRVKLQYEGRGNRLGSSSRKVRVIEGSSYRELAVLGFIS